jgi:hypothetical protein
MPKYQAITRTDFANLRWKRYESYAFAAQDAVAPLVVQELPKACMSLPIAFIQQGETFVPAAVQGLQPGQNLFVSPDGRWVGPYTPAAYRGYPFALANADNGQVVLCVDTDSGLVGEDYTETFFDEQGNKQRDTHLLLRKQTKGHPLTFSQKKQPKTKGHPLTFRNAAFLERTKEQNKGTPTYFLRNAAFGRRITKRTPTLIA